MVLVAQHAAILADPFHVAFLAVVKICDFGLLPSMRETKHVDLDGNAFYLDLLTAQHSDFLLQTPQLTIDDERTRDAALDLGVHLRADVLKEGQDGGKRSDGGYFDGGFE